MTNFVKIWYSQSEIYRNYDYLEKHIIVFVHTKIIDGFSCVCLSYPPYFETDFRLFTCNKVGDAL